jgi:hypothetical protein
LGKGAHEGKGHGWGFWWAQKEKAIAEFAVDLLKRVWSQNRP